MIAFCEGAGLSNRELPALYAPRRPRRGICAVTGWLARVAATRARPGQSPSPTAGGQTGQNCFETIDMEVRVQLGNRASTAHPAFVRILAGEYAAGIETELFRTYEP